MCCFLDGHDKDGDPYDLKDEPGETKNLFRDSRFSQTIAGLSELLKTWNTAPADA